MAQSSIEWTEATWNPVSGCVKVSPGCKHCYAERMAKRLHAMGSPNYRDGFAPTLHPDMLEAPKRWRKPRTIFVNSMSDLFQDAVPLEYIQRVFAVMNETPRHIYQVLTKRSERLRMVGDQIDWRKHVWMGVSVESDRYLHRIDDLRETPAKVRFLSVEPLLGPLPALDLASIDWVIVGGESGPGARPMAKEWVTDIRDQCEAAGVAFFFKQWGGAQKKRNGRLLDGHTHDAMPAALGEKSQQLTS